MKALLNRSLPVLLAGVLLTGSAFANGNARPVEKLAEPATLRLRAAQVSKYLAYALQLSARQQAAVRRCVYEELRSLDSLGQEPVAMVGTTTAAGQPESQQSADRIMHRYETAMARILTPGQYSAFSWLQGRQPVAKQ